MDKGPKEYTITWFIENYSFCWHNNGERLNSPDFTADGLKGTVWYMHLYPRGVDDNCRSKISLFLVRRRARCNTLNNIKLKYELFFLDPNGVPIVTSNEIENTFEGEEGFGETELAHMDDVLLRRKADFLSEDILRVCCKIRMCDGNALSATQLEAETRIGIEHLSFLHVVDDFSALKPNEKKTMQIQYPTGDELLTSSLKFSDDLCLKGKITLEITPSNTDLILTKYKLSLLDGSGKLIECGEVDNRFCSTREDIQNLPLSLTRTSLLNRKDEYLLDDKLSLLCDCTFSTGIELEKLEKIPHQVPLVAPLKIIHNKVTYNFGEKMSACTNALDDFKAIYNNHFLTDVKLKTKTKTFYTHKMVLCARSSVFKAMLTNNMEEEILDCIQVDDLDNDTVQQLLLFLYSDNVENLQWESAIKLYFAADKYNIEKLKVLCSSFLIHRLGTSNAPELLHLADTHDDLDLKSFVVNFIFEHEEEVFSSNEWEKLMEKNPPLVFKTMCLKYKRNKSV